MSVLIAAGAAAQLRYLCLSQNNDYVFAPSHAFGVFYLPIAAFDVAVFVLISLGLTVSAQIIPFALIPSIFLLSFTVWKIFSFRIKFKFSRRGTIYLIFNEILYFLICGIFAIIAKNDAIWGLIVCSIILYFPLISKLMEYPLNAYYTSKNHKFIIEQKKRLSAINPIVVGITGSYGKTSCKKILEFLIKDKFITVATEKNFNTPIGIALTVQKMKGNEQVFIAELGARKAGDISELCSIAEPQYAIISGVCEQHLETFGSIENIYNEKFKLAKAVAGRGVCVFNTNDKYVLRMWKEHVGEKIAASSYKCGDVYADGVALSRRGAEFTLHIGKEVRKCVTSLLGRHNVQNIVMCAAMAHTLGCSIDEIAYKIRILPQIEHRLEYKYANGVNIIDDGYNGNVQGVKSAFEVLSLFPHRRIVVSQGIVELGEKSCELNGDIGEKLSRVADIVILCGVNAKFIDEGLKIANYVGTVFIEKNFTYVQKRIKEIIRQGDTLLLQNDVPDFY